MNSPNKLSGQLLQLLLAIAVVVLFWFFTPTQVSAEVIYSADFENGSVPSLLKPFINIRGEVGVIDSANGQPTYNNSKYSLVNIPFVLLEQTFGTGSN